MRKEYVFTNSIKNQYVKKPKEKISMNNFSINDMLSMQKELQDKYKNKWEAISPEAGKHKLLWMTGEIGEVVDIIKKDSNLLTTITIVSYSFQT